MVLTELVIGKGEIKIVFNFIFPFIYWKGIEFVLISCSQEPGVLNIGIKSKSTSKQSFLCFCRGLINDLIKQLRQTSSNDRKKLLIPVHNQENRI